MKIKANQNYNDMQLGRMISENEEYEVSEERGKQIINAGFAVEVEEEVKVSVQIDGTEVAQEVVKKTRKRK